MLHQYYYFFHSNRGTIAPINEAYDLFDRGFSTAQGLMRWFNDAEVLKKKIHLMSHYHHSDAKMEQCAKNVLAKHLCTCKKFVSALISCILSL